MTCRLFDRARLWAVARRRDAQGAVALFLALVICFVLFPLGVLAVDIGMQRIARRDMQAVADTVALDVARRLSAGTTTAAALQTVGEQRAQQATTTLGDPPQVKVYLGYVAPGADFRSDQGRGCGGASTAYDTSGTRYFVRPPSGTEPNAVLVTSTTSVDFSMTSGSGGACRSAIAGIPAATPGQAATACYTVGSFAAAVKTGNSALLDPLMRMLAQQSGAFSNSGEIMALGFTGLADSKVDLLKLATGLRLGSINELARANVKLHDLYVATLAALVQPQNAIHVTVLNALIRNSTYTNRMVNLGNLLSVGSGVGAGAAATLNLLDLIGGSLTLINGSNFASIAAPVTLPGIANTNFQVKLIQGAHQFCGAKGDSATTATDPSLTEQLGVTSTVSLAPVNSTITVPAIAGLIGATTATVGLPNTVSTTLSVAPTSTTLTDVRCGSPKGVSVRVQNGLAKLAFELDLSNIVVDTTLLDIGLLGTNVRARLAVSGRLKVTAELGPNGATDVVIDVPDRAFDTFYPSGSSGVNVKGLDVSGLSINANQIVTLLGVISIGGSLNLDVGKKNSLINGIARSVVDQLLSTSNPSSFVNTAVKPLLGLLGTDLGGSMVSLNGTPPPTCEPKLLG